MNKLAKIRGFWPFLVVVFLNAFIDLGNKVILQNTIFNAFEGQQQIILSALVNGLIFLPFILLLTPAAFISDRYRKNRVIRFSAWMAVGVSLLLALCYHFGLFGLAFVMTFLLAIQSVFYSPAKFAYIKPLFGREKLVQGNGVVQFVSIAAMLLAAIIFSLLFEYFHFSSSITAAQILQTMAPLAWLLVVNAIIELVMAYRLPSLEQAPAQAVFCWKKYRTAGYLKDNLNPLITRRVIRMAILGLAMFWSIGQILLASFPAYAKANFSVSNSLVIQATFIVGGIGLIIGSWLAGRWSKDHIETGLIPLGACGLALALWFLPFVESSFAHVLCFFVIGLMGGLFTVPLNALIQFHAAKDEMGKVLSLSNWLQNICIISFLLITVCFALYGLDSFALLVFAAISAIVGGLYTLYKLPQSILRIVLSGSISRRYKVSVQGMQNIPEKGGVLLLGNHVSWVDWVVLQIACPRPVRFVMDKRIFSRWYLSWFFKLLKCIPINSLASSEETIKEIAATLDKGEVVALFPEGVVSHNGHLGEFKNDFESACEKTEQPLVIIPFYIRGLWGTKFSRSSDNLKNVRRRALFRNLVIAFGETMPKNSIAEQVKLRVFDLSVHSWKIHAANLPHLGCAWVDTVKRVRTQKALSDSTGKVLTSQKVLVGAIGLSKLIKKNTQTQNVGLLLPTSVAGVVANMATILAGKTIVNLNYTASQEAVANAIEQSELKQIYTSKQFLKKLHSRGVDLTTALENVELIYLEDAIKQISKTQQVVRLILVKLLPATLLKLFYVKKVDKQEVAALLFSSGSEGKPKGVMLSHTNIMANMQQLAEIVNMQENDVVVGSLPLFHAFGLTVTQFLPLIEGTPLVCHPDPTDAQAIGQVVAKYNGTIMCGTSTFFRLYAKSKKINPLMFDSLRFVISGAEKLTPQVKSVFESKFNKTISEGYGTTETTPVASVNLPDKLDKKTWQVQLGSKAGTVGMPLPGTSFKIVDPDTFEELPTGEAGLVLIGGAQIMLGYLNDPEKTESVIKEINGERWYLSGDKGKLDCDGFLTILDRYSRFAKLGGEMVSLGAVEQAVLKDQPDDIEAVALAVDDPQKGESIVLLHTGKLVSSEIKKSMLANGCNPLMIPKRWFEVEEIPKLGAGKTDFSKAKQVALGLL